MCMNTNSILLHIVNMFSFTHMWHVFLQIHLRFFLEAAVFLGLAFWHILMYNI